MTVDECRKAFTRKTVSNPSMNLERYGLWQGILISSFYKFSILMIRGGTKFTNLSYECWVEKLNRRKLFENCKSSLSEVYFALEDSQVNSAIIHDFITEISKQTMDLIKKPSQLLKELEPSQELIWTKEFIKNPLTREDVKLIEYETRNQKYSLLWNALRKKRITASLAGRVFKSKSKLSADSIWRVCESTEAMKHGILFESLALEAVGKKANQLIQPSGLWLDSGRPWLGATPDGVIYSEDKIYAVVEVKCPFTARMETITSWMENNKTCLEIKNGRTSLKKRHDYYYQIQMQMALAGTKLALFGVYTGVDLYIEWVEFDKILWNSMLQKFDKVWLDLNIEK
jgi:hypothetical protein